MSIQSGIYTETVAPTHHQRHNPWADTAGDERRAGLGKALSFAVKTLQNYTVEDEQMIEVQCFSHQAGSIGGLGKFSKVQDRHLKGDYTFVLLFLVDPGAHIIYFSTGGRESRRDDLFEENLVAPD